MTFEEIRLKLQPFLKGKTRFAYLLGSAGTPRFHAESDIDIAAHFDKKMSLADLIKVKGQLEDTLGRDVDLIDLNEIDPIFARQVIENGRILWNQDPGIHTLWRINSLSKYEDLKISRKIIEDQLLKRKKYV